MGGLQITSGSFAANSAWLVLAAIAFNLTRAAGAIASIFHTRATTATIRRQLIAVPGRLARSARQLAVADRDLRSPPQQRAKKNPHQFR